jgi:hypothetical protein
MYDVNDVAVGVWSVQARRSSTLNQSRSAGLAVPLKSASRDGVSVFGASPNHARDCVAESSINLYNSLSTSTCKFGTPAGKFGLAIIGSLQV